ncbi:polyphosphate kinase 1 [Pelagibaculum spongiae]|uniref:Polyphosphate kinase n=1 Tax=Pelagibaculum spongiae TaxID=2080658 RepID=A0A2V1GXR1_9GAMM|nr:polyphosphate kinase 1 [Pelagibaculum spongiae]PVZ66302.1 polyphosphate kinase 1 [Pelagibaculum spongiae]
MDPIDLHSTELFINRELSLLEFNRRVLELALDESLPLMERVKFLAICSSNLDEFFEVRVSGLKQQIITNTQKIGADGMPPEETLQKVSDTCHTLVSEQYLALNEVLLPLLEKENIHFVRRRDWTEQQTEWIKSYFTRQVLPVVTPIGLDPSHPFPRVVNKSLNFMMSLEGKDAFGRDSGLAIVHAPRSLPRAVRLPDEVSGGGDRFVFLSSVIHAFADDLFHGMKVNGCYQFRVTRNSDLFVDEDSIDNIAHALRGELAQRHYGDAVRLEVADNCPPEISDYLMSKYNLSRVDLYQVEGPVNLSRLMPVIDMMSRPDLKYPALHQSMPQPLDRRDNIFKAIQKQDIWLYHPYHSFNPVVQLLRQAARDPEVLAIKQTVYRTGSDSAIVKALVEAARAGKEVTAVIEVRARFDEADNIRLADKLHEAGAMVVYGVSNHKTHAKMMMVVRREGDKLRRYVHLGTGNYHTSTAKLYTDVGLMSCDEQLGEDMHYVFQTLTGMGKATRLKKLYSAPFTLHKQFSRLIDTETENALNGKTGKIIAKMNQLTDKRMIQSLYKASQAGVKIDLIVRGICSLRPGIEGVSENITVRSIAGRFLEHTRIYYFHNDGKPLVYASSADWMERNFYRRIEILFPFENQRISEKIIRFGLTPFLADNCMSWVLQPDGSYVRNQPNESEERMSAQDYLIKKLAG